jgi:hypothetical protein
MTEQRSACTGLFVLPSRPGTLLDKNEEGPDPMSDPTAATEPTPSAETLTTAPAQEHMIPKSRFDEVNTELKKLREWQQAQERERQAAADKAAAERGEWEKVATERQQRITDLESRLTPATERLSALEGEIGKQVQKRVRALPAEIREMQPDGDVLALLSWVDKAEAAAAKLGTTAPSGTPPGPRGNGMAPRADAGDLVTQKRKSADYSF